MGEWFLKIQTWSGKTFVICRKILASKQQKTSTVMGKFKRELTNFFQLNKKATPLSALKSGTLAYLFLFKVRVAYASIN